MLFGIPLFFQVLLISQILPYAKQLHFDSDNMPESWREEVDMASAIKSILDGYPFGNGLLRELLQNSDDAGSKAHVSLHSTS